ncbi:hypothetical protein Bca52824_044294 [Brassica carinata]|uniref:Uncharacterized protein n=1 Tax=Brassica carinata TaxID=52824 RepID=A0A8X7S2K2_BRACI|nr:hypothetical protein Bca52824_044294 [Brassica carinata]
MNPTCHYRFPPSGPCKHDDGCKNVCTKPPEDPNFLACITSAPMFGKCCCLVKRKVTHFKKTVNSDLRSDFAFEFIVISKRKQLHLGSWCMRSPRSSTHLLRKHMPHVSLQCACSIRRVIQHPTAFIYHIGLQNINHNTSTATTTFKKYITHAQDCLGYRKFPKKLAEPEQVLTTSRFPVLALTEEDEEKNEDNSVSEDTVQEDEEKNEDSSVKEGYVIAANPRLSRCYTAYCKSN